MSKKVRESKKRKLVALLKKGKQKANTRLDFPYHAEHSRFYEAQRHVISAAYTEVDETLQVDFEKMLPDNMFMADLQSKVLKRLFSRTQSVRANAIAKLEKSAFGEWGIENQLVFLHPKTVHRIIEAIQSETHIDNLVSLIRLLGCIHTRGFWWVGIFETIAPFFDAEPKLRAATVGATAHMEYDEKRWKAVFPILKQCKSSELASSFFYHCRNVPPKLKPELLEVLFERYELIRGRKGKSSMVGAIWLVATTRAMARKVAQRFDWSEQELAKYASIWSQLEPNPILEKELK